MNIRPIRTESDYREALSMIDSLWSKAIPGTPEGDQLDVLITLVQVYEREHHPILPPDPIEAIKFRAEQMGIGRKGLEGIIGSRARVAEVLAGTRALSIAMIRRLHRELDIPAEILIRETRRPVLRRRLRRSRAERPDAGSGSFHERRSSSGSGSDERGDADHARHDDQREK
jgi:HTH-type transcriptional regulator/antitoxin HigA